MQTQSKIRIFFALFFIAFSPLSQADSEVYTSFFSNKAASGYDVVAYFTQDKAVEGDSKFSTEYKGATWLFSSQQHLDLFKATPEKYAPQYGGYCAYAVAKGSTASADPLQWTIIDDKLYLNYNEEINQKWRQDTSKYIDSANQNWPKVLE